MLRYRLLQLLDIDFIRHLDLALQIYIGVDTFGLVWLPLFTDIFQRFDELPDAFFAFLGRKWSVAFLVYEHYVHATVAFGQVLPQLLEFVLEVCVGHTPRKANFLQHLLATSGHTFLDMPLFEGLGARGFEVYDFDYRIWALLDEFDDEAIVFGDGFEDVGKTANGAVRACRRIEKMHIFNLDFIPSTWFGCWIVLGDFGTFGSGLSRIITLALIKSYWRRMEGRR
jgi:hypothetical protein